LTVVRRLKYRAMEADPMDATKKASLTLRKGDSTSSLSLCLTV
jgi:hypothetical protein